jgi:hypothetical protein
MIQNINTDANGRVVSGKCHCGAMVDLGGFTCECELCGRLYNWCGQELRPESEWEEEW